MEMKYSDFYVFSREMRSILDSASLDFPVILIRSHQTHLFAFKPIPSDPPVWFWSVSTCVIYVIFVVYQYSHQRIVNGTQISWL